MEGRLYVIGMGPGSGEMMTPQAARALERCQVIARAIRCMWSC